MKQANLNTVRIFDNAKQRAARIKQLSQQNMQNFIKKFPGQKKFELQKMKRRHLASSSLDPDTYFCTFIINVMLILVTLNAIFTQRNFSEEYFIQRNIEAVFSQDIINIQTPGGEDQTVKGTKFRDIKHFDDF